MRKCRFIAPSADSSALGGFPSIQMKKLNIIYHLHLHFQAFSIGGEFIAPNLFDRPPVAARKKKAFMWEHPHLSKGLPPSALSQGSSTQGILYHALTTSCKFPSVFQGERKKVSKTILLQLNKSPCIMAATKKQTLQVWLIHPQRTLNRLLLQCVRFYAGGCHGKKKMPGGIKHPTIKAHIFIHAEE